MTTRIGEHHETIAQLLSHEKTKADIAATYKNAITKVAQSDAAFKTGELDFLLAHRINGGQIPTAAHTLLEHIDQRRW